MWNKSCGCIDILKLLIIYGFVKVSWSASVSQYWESPCPTLFEYRTDETGNLYGIIQIDSVYDNGYVQLEVELSIGNSVQGYQGNLELAYSREQILEEIMQKKPIIYRVRFPTWINLPPRLTKIVLNGQLICSGPKIPFDNQVQVLTTITLQNNLRISVAPLSAVNTPRPQNTFPIVDNTNTFQVPNFEKNRYNFHPIPPKNGQGQVHKIYYTPPKPEEGPGVHTPDPPEINPTKIYPSNPFFSNLPSNGNNFISEQVPVTKPVITQFPEVVPTNFPPRRVTSPNNNNINRRNAPFSDICGRPVATNSLVVHGQSVPRGAYPWLVAMYEIMNIGLMYKCCGSLISSKHVVTAAHCVKTDQKRFQPHEIIFRLGKLNIREWNQDDNERMIAPETIDIHPDYRPLTSDADIAVITLSKTVEFTKLIRPICLWSGSNRLSEVVGTNGVVVGWGKDENGVPNTSLPRQTTLPIVTQEQCLRSAYQYRDITSERTFCAGYRNGTGPCNGDSGSGLLLKRGDKWTLRGIVSMSISASGVVTCDLNNYIVFTDASKFTNWLLTFVT